MSKRIEWIDTAKGLGLLLVIIGHLKTPFLASWIYTFHMPLFFILSGFVFSSDKYTFREFFKKRVNTLVIPYFCLGMVIFLWYSGIYYFQDRPAVEYGIMLKDFLVQKHYWTIWFLAALFLTEIIYFGIDYLCKGRLLVSTIVSSIVAFCGFIWYRLGGEGIAWNLDVAVIAQFFFHIGYCLRRNMFVTNYVVDGNYLRRVCIILALLVLNVSLGKLCIILSGESLDMSIGMYGNEICTILSAIAGSLSILGLCSMIHNRFLNWLGKNTMVVFSWHSRIGIVGLGFLYQYYNLFVETTIACRLQYTFISLFILLALFIPITLIIKKTPYHRFFGV